MPSTTAAALLLRAVSAADPGSLLTVNADPFEDGQWRAVGQHDPDEELLEESLYMLQRAVCVAGWTHPVLLQRAVHLGDKCSVWAPHAVSRGGSLSFVTSMEAFDWRRPPAAPIAVFDVLTGAHDAIATPEQGAGLPGGQWWAVWAPGVCTKLCSRDDGPPSPVARARDAPWAAPPLSAPPPHTPIKALTRPRIPQEDSVQLSVHVSPQAWAAAMDKLWGRCASTEEYARLADVARRAADAVGSPHDFDFYVERVLATDQQRDGIAACEQRTPAWHAQRGLRWTGSKMAKAGGVSDYPQSVHKLVHESLFPVYHSNAAMQHGTDNEPRSHRACLLGQAAAASAPVHYAECGMVVHPTEPWMGGSPDMVVLAAHGVDAHAGTAGRRVADAAVRCSTFQEARLPACVAAAAGGAGVAALGELKCPTRGEFYRGGVWGKADYTAQLHCNMACLGLRTAVFSQFLTQGAQVSESVVFSDAYWSGLLHTARATYFNHLLPRLVWKAQGVLDPETLMPLKPLHCLEVSFNNYGEEVEEIESCDDES